jgi:hypothetical protein
MNRFLKGFLFFVGGVVLLLIVVRVVGSPVATHFVNRKLERMAQFTGRVDAVQLALWRGTVSVRGLQLVDRAHQEDGPVVTAENAMLSIAWAPLFRGRLGGHGNADHVRITVMKRAETAKDEKEKAERLARPVERAWQAVLQKEFPLELTKLELKESELHFEDRSDAQPVVLVVDQIELTATGFSNREKRSGEMPAAVHLTARVGGSGQLRVEARADPAERLPRFTANMELKGFALPPNHDFLVRYALIDASAGEFEVYSEVNAANGHYEGYLKPFFKDLKFKAVPDPEKSILQRAATKVAAAATRLLKNEEGNVATKAPFQGDFDDTQVDVWVTIENLLRNAFIRALREGLEGQTPAGTG